MERESVPNQNYEKPRVLYHGTLYGEIKEFEPRKRFTPGGKSMSKRVYAAENPAFAAAHSFPWISKEGVDIDINDGVVTLKVPKSLSHRLKQPVYIYKLDGKNFDKTTEESAGMTFHSELPVVPDGVESFADVNSAVEYFGGKVEIIEDTG